MPADHFTAALLRLIESGEGIPLNIRLEPSSEIKRLQSEIDEYKQQAILEKEKRERTEFHYLRLQAEYDLLLEWLYDERIKIPRSLRKR